MIPNSLIRDENLPSPLFRTLVAIMSYGYGNNKAFPSQESVAKAIGKTRETVNRQVQELTKLGYLKKKRRGYSLSNEYDFYCDENITNEEMASDRKSTPSVTKTSPHSLQNDHTNNTNNKTKNNKGLESLREKMVELGLKKQK